MTSEKPKVVFLTGSGLSADSGIPTFRGRGGIYQGIAAEDIVSAVTLRKNPELLQRFCDDMRMGMKGIVPNDAHGMIAGLARDYGDRVIHLTQNIDGLMALAGHLETIELHGSIKRMKSLLKPNIQVEIGFKRYWSGTDEERPDQGFQFRCPKTNCFFRPDIILFEEMAPNYKLLHAALGDLNPQDVFVVIGTQGVVLPINVFAIQAHCLRILNNLHESEDIDETLFNYSFLERAATAATKIDKIVRERLG